MKLHAKELGIKYIGLWTDQFVPKMMVKNGMYRSI